VHSASFRRVARLFAIVLLLWTAADVCDYGLCVHHRDPIGSFADTAFRAPASDPDDRAGSDDCFCCSHVVDVRLPFRMCVAHAVARVVADDVPAQPHLRSVPLYHPPIGA
jgi:hypothetical protein